MSRSLKDQLLKQGLVNKDQVHKSRAKKKKSGQAIASPEDDAKQQAKIAQAEKVARDKALNAERKQAEEQKDVQNQIRQLIDSNRISRDDGDLAYNFKDQKKIRKVYLSQILTNQLSGGQIALVSAGLKDSESFELIPRAVADKVREKDASRILVLNDSPDQANVDDDPYADFQIPDDLTW